MFYISATFYENISNGFIGIKSRDIFTLKFSKGHNSVNNVGGVTVLVFCMLSDHV